MREFYNVDQFKEYISSLNTKDGDKPFDCPHLKILPEGITYKGDNRQESAQKGDLICAAIVERNGVRSNVLCNLQGGRGITVKEGGELETFCGWNGSRFTLRIVNFEKGED